MRLKSDPHAASERWGDSRRRRPGLASRPGPTPRSGGSLATPSPIFPPGRCPLWPPGPFGVPASLSHLLSTPRDTMLASQVTPWTEGTLSGGEGVFPGREASSQA